MANDFKDISEIVKEYYSNPNIVKRYIKVELWPSEKKVIEKYFERGSTVLDIGCGAGRTTIALVKAGYEVTGIDFIPEMIEAAKYQAYLNNVNVNFKMMDAVNMDFPDEFFHNALFSFNGFEQIPGKKNRENILRNVWKILKPGGCFILTARSGLAIGRRTMAWALMSFEYLYLQLINGKRKKNEFGDKIYKGEYHHYINPFKFKALVRTIGFKNVYFNSSKNIERENNSTFLTNFSNDIALFYVLKKEQ